MKSQDIQEEEKVRKKTEIYPTMWKHDKHFEKETDVEILTSIERDKINKLKEKHMTRKKGTRK